MLTRINQEGVLGVVAVVAVVAVMAVVAVVAVVVELDISSSASSSGEEL